MADAMTPDSLIGHWVHSHEDDTSSGMVFRPADYPFPPSRGRLGYVFNPGGELIEAGPGPTDRPQTVIGAWTLEGETLVLHLPGGDQRLRIVSFDSERLVVRR
jgi:hypothetical protein